MKERIRQLHSHRIFSLLFWLIAIFAAIVMMPNTSDMIQSKGQPQLANDSQPMVARSMQSTWGRNISGTSQVTVVFSNPNGKLTTTQQSNIDKTVQRLTEKQKTYGIQSIQTMTTNPTAKSQFYSKDGSTETIQLALAQNQGDSRVLAKQLRSQIRTAGLSTYLTSPELVNDAANENISHVTTFAAILGFILSLLIIGVIFKSLIAPLISTLSMLMMYAVSLSLVNNLASHTSFPYSEYLPLLTLLLTLILGTLGFYYLFNAFKENAAAGQDPAEATTHSVHAIRNFLLILGCTLTILFASFYAFSFSTIRAMSSLAIVTIVTIIGLYTIAPIFMQLLGERFFWPAADLPTRPHRFWNWMASFGLWQPFVAIIAVLYVVGPFAILYRDNLNFSAAKTVAPNNEAISGMRVLNAHFGEGKATPVTIYVRSKDRVDNEKALLQLDNLTTKLKSMPGVAGVTSLTQPNGQPMNQYYVNTQLNQMNTSLRGATDQLSTLQSDLKSNRSDLSQVKLSESADKLDSLVSKTTTLADDTSTVRSQVSQVAGRASVSQSSSASKRVRNYQRLLNLVSNQLQTVASNMRVLNDEATTAGNDGQAVQSSVSDYASQVSSVQSSLKKTTTSLNGLIKSYNSIYSYLSALQASDAAKTYYITPEQLTSMQFQQSLASNTSQDYKTTQLQIYLKNSASSHNNAATIQQLQSEVKTQLQGTALSNAKIAYTGQPVVQNTVEHAIKTNAGWLLLTIGIITFLIIAILSGSVLQPIYWLTSLALAVMGGVQLAELTSHFMSGDPTFNWQVPFIAFVPLLIISMSLLIQLAISYRFKEVSLLDWLQPGVSSLGQTLRYQLFTMVIICLVLFSANFAPLTQAGLVILFATIIFDIILPIIVTSVGKLTVTLPTMRPHLKRHAK
ncbi:MMPL family transporter [Lactobacillus sp. LC28-10]|uniref:MMPL family transporter n=1 Tax=Secundilactobacillus angelensis TaxID=2722706 RepID=A0ABX1KYN4_9LACO|nr:MMPL family transporter [Secundilactobacillus angelensis]MCH5462322.1 MMPL family transporter [Secundilactobacillus angelensis]NLR19061.1 MMPL family transporter [Secundilactobacillus angelensis]